jgi:hypothetical protein
MDHPQEPGRLTVDEFMRFAKFVLDLFGKTHVSPEDQSKLDFMFAALQENDPKVDEALKNNK